VVVGGHTGHTGVPGHEEIAALVAAEEATGASRRDAIKSVARRRGLARRTVYDAAHGLSGPSGTADEPSGDAR
jgi:16S rRNA (cytidine1402-2'-O)-methyltransferase